MRLIARLTIALSLLCMFALRAQAEDEPLYYHEPAPGAGIGAAFINVVQLPLRLVATTCMGVLGGFTGFMLGGDQHGAWDTWNLAGGDQIVTAEMLQGRERYKFTSYDPRPQ